MKLKDRWKSQVKIKAEGSQLPRFLSLLAARQILYRNAFWQGKTLFLELSARQYRAAAECARKAGVRIRIVSRRGPAFFCFRHRRRKWALLFVLPMLIGVGLMPCFLWTIRLEGLESVTQVEMLARLEAAGVHTGMWKGDLDTQQVKEQMLLAYPDLSFLSLRLEGTQLLVTAAEAEKAPEMVERYAPCDVVAGETCVIYSIVTESGKPLVQRGDVVQEGDLLIQGLVTLTDDDGNQTELPAHAAGVVYGKRTCVLEESMESTYEKQIWGDTAQSGLILRLGTHQLELRSPFGKQKQEAVCEEAVLQLSVGDGFSIGRREYWPYTTEPAVYTEEEMQEILAQRLEKRKAALLAEKSRVVLQEEVQFEQTQTGCRSVLKLTLMEDVGVLTPQ